MAVSESQGEGEGGGDSNEVYVFSVFQSFDLPTVCKLASLQAQVNSGKIVCLLTVE